MTKGSFFLSYAHANPDEQISDWIAATLRADDHTVWMDRQLRAKSGGKLNTEISKAITQSSHFLCVCSSMWVTSDYCQSEAIFAMEIGKPIVRLDIERIDGLSLPPSLLPFQSLHSRAVFFYGRDKSEWPLLLANALADQGLGLSQSAIDPVDLTPNARIIRPNYARLKSGSHDYLNSVYERLAKAKAIVPQNGYNALSLSLLRSFLGEGELALEEAEIAMQHLPNYSDGYYAAALADCVRRSKTKRSLPEVKRILSRLETAMSFSRPGQHLYLLYGLIVESYFEKRYLKSKIPAQDIFDRGRKQGVSSPEECQRVWDLEGVTHSQYGDEARAFGVDV